MPQGFISYRRSDTRHAAEGLYSQLMTRFGPSHVFMDTNSITAGVRWPLRIREALESAQVVIVLIGPSWLTASDKFGRRRIDQADDWVRQELIATLEAGRPIIPILVGSDAEVSMPPAEGLPEELAGMIEHQARRLRDDTWADDVQALSDVLVRDYDFPRPVRLDFPRPEVDIPSIAASELERLLAGPLARWEPVESLMPGDYPRSRHELRRVFRFGSFLKAIDFMQQAAQVAERHQHHPRWENQWKSVSVHLSTWDIGHRISQLDVDLALALDALYERGDADL